MKFQAATGHAIRILICIGKNNRAFTQAMDMSKELDISYLYFMKISGYLKHAELVQSEQGRNGGYRLARPLDKISVYDVVHAVEGDMDIDERIIRGGGTASDSMHHFFMEIQKEMIQRMRETKIQELYREQTQMHDMAVGR